MRHLYALVFLLLTGLASAQTFTSVIGGVWDDPATWDVGGGLYPEAGDDVIISSGHIVRNNGSQAAASITLNGSGKLNFSSNGTITLTGDLTMNGSSDIVSFSFSRSLVVGGNLTINGNNDVGGVGLLISGDATISDGATLRFVYGIGTKSSSNLTINGTGAMNINSTTQTFSVSGTTQLNGSSSITGSSTGTLSTSNIEVNGSAVTIGRVNLIVSNNLTIEDGANLNFNVALGTKNMNNVIVNGTGQLAPSASVTLNLSGTLEMNNTSSIDGVSTGTINVENLAINGSDIDFGRFNLNVSDHTTISDGALLTFSFATFGAINFNDVTMNGTAAIEFDEVENVNVSGTFTMNGTSSFGGGAAKGELDAGTLNFAGTSHTIGESDIIVTGTTTIGSALTFSSSSGSFSTGGLILNADFTLPFEISVDGELDLSGGTSDLTLADHDLTLEETGRVKGGGPGGYIKQTGNGRFRKRFPTSGFSDPITIPFGDSDDYAPMTFTLRSESSVSSGARIRFRYREASGHPNRDDSNTGDLGDDLGVAAVDYVNDYWEFTTTNISDIHFDATCDFSANGKSGAGAATSMFPVIRRRATPPGGSETYDWHVTGYNNHFGTGSVSLSEIITFSNIRNIENALTTWVLYAMDNLSIGSERLPITLISFDAVQVENHVELNWATADEVNNEFFTIERSTNGFDFQPILSVAGAGNSEVRLEYSAIDPAPIEGRGYYRLKQTDFNGQFAYSEIEAIEFIPNNELRDEMGVYPNPLNRGASIKLTGTGIFESEGATYTLYTNAGEIVKSGAAIDILAGEIRLEKSGLYLLQVNHSEGKETIKILVH